MPVRLIIVPWLIPAWARAQVWGNLILIRRGVNVTEELLAHELAHVHQWRTLGVFPFLFQYLRGLIRSAYWDHPLEIAARAAARQDFYRRWAWQILRQSP